MKMIQDLKEKGPTSSTFRSIVEASFPPRDFFRKAYKSFEAHSFQQELVGKGRGEAGPFNSTQA